MVLDVETFVKLKQNIHNADQFIQLRSLRDQFQLSIQHNEQIFHKDSIAMWNVQINEVHDAFITRTIALTELRMVGEGHGPPPTAYSYLLLGSAGRHEQTMASDQDSAFIFENEDNLEEIREYYKLFASKIVANLIELGYPPCDGKVQSNEDLWCQSVQEWETKLEAWYEDASWESIRYLLIVADARCIHGNDSLLLRIKAFYRECLAARPYILERMIENTVQHKMLLGVFGQFITDRYGEYMGSIDVKYGAYIPLVNCFRWLALSEGVATTSTLERIQQLGQAGVLTERELIAYRDAFEQMLSLRLMAGYEFVDGMYEGVSKLNPKRLEADEIKRLKKNLKIGRDLQRLVMKRYARRRTV